MDAMVITNSSFASQELWMNGLCDQGHYLHMIWYSQNFIPKQYAGEVKKSNLPQARHIRVNAHWVWTNGFRDYLRSIGQTCDIYSVGPLLWYLRDNESKLSLNGRYKVILFDVTPIRASFKTFATTRNYYTFATISKFVSDSVDVCNELSSKYGIDIHVYLKHKRAIGSHHDPRYIKFIDDMLRFNDSFKVIDHEVDLFELIASANLSIAVPYTSTVCVSMFLEKMAIYYDSSGDLTPSYESFEGLSFVNSKSNLHSRVEECISQQVK